MDRRDFLRKGAFGASGFVAADSVVREEGEAPPKFSELRADDMEEYLARVDAGMAQMTGWSLGDDLMSAAAEHPDRLELGRNIMGSLFLTGMFGDLPADQQAHPGMQDRLWQWSSMMDETLDGVKTLLREQRPEDLQRVRANLRERPEVLHQVVQMIDTQAERAGLSEPRRTQLRLTFNEVGWRLQNQAPELIIDEYLAKTEALVASDVEGAARERWLMARMGEDAFWQAQQSDRERRVGMGLKAMGIGIALFLGGALLLSAADGADGGGVNDVIAVIGLVPGITGGFVTFVVGFVIFIFGLLSSGEVPAARGQGEGEVGQPA